MREAVRRECHVTSDATAAAIFNDLDRLCVCVCVCARARVGAGLSHTLSLFISLFSQPPLVPARAHDNASFVTCCTQHDKQLVALYLQQRGRTHLLGGIPGCGDRE